MNRKLISTLTIIGMISLSIFVFGMIYEHELPKIVEELNNSAIGAILTAIITVLLLSQQSSSEEIKERNVKVFSEKSERFNIFIDKLWEIWEDRVVTLEELNELIKMVSKEIVLYTKPETVDKILSHMIEIAELARPDKTNKKDAESTKIIQENIFNIINELAKEIGLGGEIKPEIRTKLNSLEDKVIPYLIQKDFKKTYVESFKQTIERDDEVDITDVEYKNGDLWCRVKDSKLSIRIGPLERENHQNVLVAAYAEFWSNRNYTPYRDAGKGWRKDYIRGMMQGYNSADIINFNDFEAVEKRFYELSNKENTNNNELAEKVIRLYKSWKAFDGKNIEGVIDACEPKNV